MRSRTLIVIFALTSAIAVYFISGSASQPSKLKLESGDIVFRKENSFWGDIASSLARKDGQYSHSGVVLVEKDKIFVIHAYANTQKQEAKVSKESLEEFSKNASAIGYYRLNFPKIIRQDVAKVALSYYNQKTPFDDKFNLSSDAAVYCTELVWRSIKMASGYDVAPTKSKAMNQDYIGNDDLFLGGFMQPI